MGTTGGGKRFPLWRHKATGQWCKKIRGKFYYFGVDKTAALEAYERDRKDLEEGRTPRPATGGVTVADVVNGFLTARRTKVNSRELTAGMWGEYYGACERIVDVFGRDRLVYDLRPADFGKLRSVLAERLGPVSLAKFITMTRTVFSWAYKSELIDTPIRFGSEFEKPARRILRLEKARKGPKLISAVDAWKLLASADVQLRAMILLGLNCGYGATDCAGLQRRMLTLRPGWSDYPRQKTGTARRCPLWPETVEALAAVAAMRPEPKSDADADCVFLTRQHRNRWVRYRDRGDGKRGVTMDAVAYEFAKLVKATGVNVKGFYTLRHTFRTVADEVKDQAAAMLLMGHADLSISGYYRELISDDRLEAVTDHVRTWLLAGKPVPVES